MSTDQIKLGETWEAIGPFPSGMREHPLLSSSLAAYVDPAQNPDVYLAHRPYEELETWPSELGHGGRVGWKTFQTGEDGWLEVSYPEIRWDQLRSDHGWAALQYQSILRTTVNIPAIAGQDITPILIDVIQGTEFALIPIRPPLSLSSSNELDQTGKSRPVRWYSGDIYDFASTPSGSKDQAGRLSNFARSLAYPPGEYIFLIRAIYEIRMFGDPAPAPPTIRIKVQAEIYPSLGPKLVEGLAEVPDMINGRFMGDWVSVPVQAPATHKSLTIVGVESSFDKLLRLSIPRQTDVIPGQICPIAIRLEQIAPLPHCVSSIRIRIKIEIGESVEVLDWRPQFQHFVSNEGQSLTSALKPFKITFASPTLSALSTSPAQVSHAVIVPPRSLRTGSGSAYNTPPVLLALHGAGVDASSSFWVDAMPDVDGGWAVLPTGHNEWGEDWHGGSMGDVWAARESFGMMIRKLDIVVSEQTLLIGHSNGGQGVWHLAARYPDRIAGALMGVLNSALTPYNNDLYLSNLVDIPILVLHGAEDDNVPPRHSKAYVNLISAWSGHLARSKVKLIEVPKKNHWWEGGLQSTEVIDFINNLPDRSSWDEQRRSGFTLTTANPDESGGRAGIRIVELNTPGRLARLDVNARQWRDHSPAFPLDLRGTNIKRIEVASSSSRNGSGNGETLIQQGREWKSEGEGDLGLLTRPRAYGPMIRLLATCAPMTIIIPSSSLSPSSRSQSSSTNSDIHLNIAQRISHDLYVYHRISIEIFSDREALSRVARNEIGDGNVVVIGRPEDNVYTNWMINQKRIPLQFPTQGVMLLDDRVIYDKGAGIITLHPHPTSQRGLSALIAGNDELGLELAARLFPIRTGVPIPDWVVVSPRMRWRGAGGLIGAGFWDGEWGWSESMSWVDR